MKDEGPAAPSDPPKIERKELPNETYGVKALEELMPLVYEELRLLAGVICAMNDPSIRCSGRHSCMKHTCASSASDESDGKTAGYDNN